MKDGMTVAEYLSAVMDFAKKRALLDISFDVAKGLIKLVPPSRTRVPIARHRVADGPQRG
jgi:hypothetical protein